MLGVSSCHHGKMEDVAKQRREKVTENCRQRGTEKTERAQVMIKEERRE